MFELLLTLSALSPVRITVYAGNNQPLQTYNVWGLYRPHAKSQAIDSMTTANTVVIVSK